MATICLWARIWGAVDDRKKREAKRLFKKLFIEYVIYGSEMRAGQQDLRYLVVLHHSQESFLRLGAVGCQFNKYLF